jgi:hypothetical protein
VYNPRLAVGSAPLARPAEVSTTGWQLPALRRLESAFAKDRIRSIAVSLEGGKATLRGTVSSEHERTLAALMALFEPGISEVQNQLVVGSPAADPGTASPGQAAPAEAAGAAAPSSAPAKGSAQP